MESRNVPFSLISDSGRNRYPEATNHRCAFMASIMAEFHNFLIRAFNSAYLNADKVRPATKDASDLLQYMEILCDIMETHHDWEENSYFPALEAFAKQPGLLQSNISQHQEFEAGLHLLHNYCREPNSEQHYSPVKFKALINDLATPLQKHLHDEPPTFYGLRHTDSDKLDQVYLEQEKIAMKKGDPWRFF